MESGRPARSPSRARISSETRLSDVRVPGIVSFGRGGPQTLAEPFQTVGNRQVGDEFHALVAELAVEPESKGSALADGKLIAIHPVDEESLRVQCIGHIDAFPLVRIDREIENVSGLRKDSHEFQHVRERHPDLLGYI